MAIDNFKPEMWASELIVALRKTLVYASPDITNHDYEGLIEQAGDTVHISSIGDVTVFDYNKGDTLTYTDVDDAGLTITISQKKAFAKKLDDVDKAQALNGGAVMAQIMQNAAYNLADIVDQYIASFYTQTQAANVLPAVTDLSAAGTAYDTLVDLGVMLDEANVPTEGRYAVIPPWFHGVIRKDPNFINANKSADGGEALHNGIVGEAAGFSLRKSNNTPVPGAGTNVIQGGVSMAVSFAQQLAEVEALRLQTTFADAVRGLHLYGANVVRPDALACVTVTRPS
jgi:coat protein Gp5